MSCDRDCFNCKFEDCVNDEISASERLDSIERDNEVVRDKALTYKAQYYHANKDKCRRWSRENYHRHAESKREKSREYYRTHKEKFREYDKRWKEEHKDLIKIRQHQYYLNWKKKRDQREIQNG